MARILCMVALITLAMLLLAPGDLSLTFSDNPGLDRLISAIETRDSAALRRSLCGAAANVNARAGNGETPLMHAAGTGWVRGAKLLLEAGADVNVGSGISGEVAVHRAVDAPGNDALQMIDLLIRYG